METTKSKIPGFVRITCDKNHYLHRVGSEEYPEIHDVTVPEYRAAEWEEIPLAEVPKYTEEEYKTKTAELIRRKYSQDDEIALINNVMANATTKRQNEYAAYQEYREQCKQEAREQLENKPTEAP